MKKSILMTCAALMFSAAAFAEPAAPEKKEEAKPAQPASIACAVMTDHKVDIAKATEKKKFADYKGNRYFFCCGGCVTSFNKDPEKYIKSAHVKAPEAPQPKEAEKPKEEAPAH